MVDRREIGEAIAEMGHRPKEEELDEFFALFDTVSSTFNAWRMISSLKSDATLRVQNKNGTIDLVRSACPCWPVPFADDQRGSLALQYAGKQGQLRSLVRLPCETAAEQ